MDFLSDTWAIEGKEYDEFKEQLEKFEKQTIIKEIPMDEFSFLSISDMGVGYMAYPMGTGTVWKKNKTSLSLKMLPVNKDMFIMNGYGDDVVNESFDNGLFTIFSKKKLTMPKISKSINEGEFLPVSAKAISTIANRIKYGGSNFFTDRLIRDMAIASHFDKPIPVSAVLRTDSESGKQKVFAVMSEKYTIIPQKTIISIIDKISKEAEADLGKTVISDWYIDHSVTRINLDFPEKAEEIAETYSMAESMVPGIMIETSDIGDCSLRLRGYFKIGSYTVYTKNEYVQIHSGKFDEAEAVNAATGKIFPEYMSYPKKLVSLMAIDITDDSMSSAMKIKKMTKAYKDVSKKIGLVKEIGKKREKPLMEQLINGINTDISYTAYDVAMTFLTLPKMILSDNKNLIRSIAKITVNTLDAFDEEDDLLIA